MLLSTATGLLRYRHLLVRSEAAIAEPANGASHSPPDTGTFP
jgi:hypothetical protein